MFGRKKTKEESPWANLTDKPQLTERCPEPYIVPGKEMKEQTDALYMVGTLDDGRVQLRVGYPTSVTLTMNDVGVRRLIKMLEAAIDNEEDNSNDC